MFFHFLASFNIALLLNFYTTGAVCPTYLKLFTNNCFINKYQYQDIVFLFISKFQGHLTL